jgi:hypothetical protein
VKEKEIRKERRNELAFLMIEYATGLLLLKVKTTS